MEAPTPVKGGTLVPMPYLVTLPVFVGPAGTVILPGIPGGGGPLEIFVQAVHPDPELPGGWGFSNAVRLDYLP